MLRKKLGLSTEPQPVFVGGCFTLVMLLMQFYTMQLASSGNFLSGLNNPAVIVRIMTSSALNGQIYSAVWLAKVIVPVIMLVCAIFLGKKHAKLLAVPSAFAFSFLAPVFAGGDFQLYGISFIVYAVSVVFYVLTAFGIIKSVKPFIIYCVAVCVLTVLLTVLKQPPFTLYDGTVYVSDAIYFVCYHITVANFARAVPMQRKTD